MATVIISLLLIATIVGAWLVGAILIRNIKRTSTSSGGTSTPPTSSSTSSSPAPASGGNWWGKARGINWSVLLLGMVGIYLLTRMIVLGGVLPGEEILVLAVIILIAVLLNTKTLFFALLIVAILLVNFLHPNVNKDIKSMRENQINPPGEMAAIVINRDGEYDLPDRPLKICFTQTGLPEKDFYIDQQISIGDWSNTPQRKPGCQDIPKYITGKVNVSLGSAGKTYTPEIRKQWDVTDPKITNDYTYSFAKGVGKFPTIQAR